ncbi:uncharacterized protein LOC112451748 [Temnothorax curvispinosus]|uniref:Uncharacterized protein LOC112451748 n=1 Tax=Temnothorax curvispinosus TaxID=300111 RepID=A0A6J1PD08_9HYME|nr:uncharacterized protein LOC112451748 [Temnothorax curvispinosus]
MNLLIKQARDILVCGYHGNMENFVRTYLSPAATLLAKVKNVAASETGNEAVVPEGWPLILGSSGLILQLGELEMSALRLGECYLWVRSAAAATATATTSYENVFCSLLPKNLEIYNRLLNTSSCLLNYIRRPVTLAQSMCASQKSSNFS